MLKTLLSFFCTSCFLAFKKCIVGWIEVPCRPQTAKGADVPYCTEEIDGKIV